jgi:DNA-binding transcriptional LysR family regulator
VERTTRRLAATEAGRSLASRAHVLLDLYAEAMRVPAEAALRGILRITAPVVFGRRHVTPCVLAFQAANPDLRVELDWRTATWIWSRKGWMWRSGLARCPTQA